LKGALKYGDVLAGVERADLWSLTTNLDGEKLGALADHLVNRTSVFVNPNKHRWRVWSEGAKAEKVKSGAWVLVWDSEDTEGRRAHAELRGAGFEKEIKNVSKATLWRLSFEDAARGKELSLAEEMAVAVRRDQGLLANPHIHRWVCGEGDIGLEEAVAHLDAGRE
jgi:phosphoribosylformylglycinamidine (FGAM) synthase PurS component